MEEEKTFEVAPVPRPIESSQEEEKIDTSQVLGQSGLRTIGTSSMFSTVPGDNLEKSYGTNRDCSNLLSPSIRQFNYQNRSEPQKHSMYIRDVKSLDIGIKPIQRKEDTSDKL